MASGKTTSKYERLYFNGDERNYEVWEVKFLSYMRLKKLRKIILHPEGEADPADFEELNEECFAELCQFLDDRSLALVMRDAKDDGRDALKLLRQHYAGTSKPRIINLYTQLTSLVKGSDESITDYVLRAETASASLKE